MDEKIKSSKIILVAEGDDAGGAFVIAEQVKKRLPFYDTRVTILGHIQRGGNPTCSDRVLASRLGHAAVEALIHGKSNMMVGTVHDKIHFTPFEKAVKHHVSVDSELLNLADVLSY